jgi:hypothetical protein
MHALTIISKLHPVTSRLHRRGWILFTILGALIPALPALADGPEIPDYFKKTDYQIAQEVAPRVFFHPEEHNWPVTIEWFMAHSNLVSKTNPTVVQPAGDVNHVLALTSGGSTSADYYLDIPTSVPNGDPILNGDPDLSHTKPYVRVLNHNVLFTALDNGKLFFLPAYKEVQFWFLFAYNGCQTHRITALGSDLKYDTSRFQMCDAARHEGDLEVISVYINNSTGRPMGVGMSRHGAVVYSAWERLQVTGHHPHIYPAWASHAMYFSNGYHGLGPDMAGAASICGIINLDYWKIVDLRAAGGKEWNPDEHKQNLVLLDQTSPVTKYLGAWGRYEMHNRTVQTPAAAGFDTNNGRDVVVNVSDTKIRDCFDTLVSLSRFFYDFTDFLGSNPIYRFGPEGLDEKTFVGHGPEWFSKTAWLVGMIPEAVD